MQQYKISFPVTSASHVMIYITWYLPCLSKRLRKYWAIYWSQVNKSQRISSFQRKWSMYCSVENKGLTSVLRVIISNDPAALLKLTILNWPEIEDIIHKFPLQYRDKWKFIVEWESICRLLDFFSGCFRCNRNSSIPMGIAVAML